MESLQKIKNTRILELLEEISCHIEPQVKPQVVDGITESNEQKNKAALSKTEEGLAKKLEISSKVTYDLIQSNKEKIKEKPKILEGVTLKDFQMEGLEWMISLYNSKLNGILADEMGLGKTVQLIAFLCYLIQSKQNTGPFLIVVPLSTLSNWANEFEKWAPSIVKVAYIGEPKKRKEIISTMETTAWNVCLTTFEMALTDCSVLKEHNWQYIIIDEGHRLKNQKSKFSQTIQEYKSEYRLLLMGTPLGNNISELLSYLSFIQPKLANSSEEFENLIEDKGYKPTQEEEAFIINNLQQILRPLYLRRVKSEIENDIPKKAEYVIKVELSQWQKIVYEQIKAKGMTNLDTTGNIDKKVFLNLMMQLRKICNHPYVFMEADQYINNVDDNIFRVSGKFELLDRILPKLIAAKHKILIFCQTTIVMDLLDIYFEYKGFKSLRLDGSTGSQERAKLVALFDKPDCEFNIFVLSTRVGGLGLKLQFLKTADTVILFDSDWNPNMDLQAQSVAHGIGSKHEVRVLRLVTNTWIEQEMISNTNNNNNVPIQFDIPNQKENTIIEKLQGILNRGSSDSGPEGEIPDDEEINQIIARNDEEFSLFQQLDQERYDKEKNVYLNFKYPQKGEGKFYNYRLITLNEVPSWVKGDE